MGIPDFAKHGLGRGLLAVGTMGLSEAGGLRTIADAMAPDAPGKAKTAAEWRALDPNMSSDDQKNLKDQNLILPDPVKTPDLTDDLVQRARLAAIRRAQMGGALQQTFLTGPLGDTSSPTTKTPGITGT